MTTKISIKHGLAQGDHHTLLALLERAATCKSAPKYLAEVSRRLQANMNAFEPLPMIGNELVHTEHGIDFTIAELGIKGFGSVLVNSNQVADRLGADKHKFNQMIESNKKFLNEFGVLTFEVETSGAKGGRPGKHYMLNQGQVAYLINRTETQSGRAFSVVFTKAFFKLIEWYVSNRPKFEVLKRENAGTGLWDQNEELRRQLDKAMQKADHWECVAKRSQFSENAFNEAIEYRTRPGHKRQRAGHVRTISRTVVNSTAQ